MNQVIISSVLNKSKDQVIYVHDFLDMWRFHVQFIQHISTTQTPSICINSIGKKPENSPEIKFESEL